MLSFFFWWSCNEPQKNIEIEALPVLPDRVQAVQIPKGPQTTYREAVISLVGEVRGEIEPCGCPTLPYGGFERRAQFFETIPNDLPHFQLDAGEQLLKGFSAEDRDASTQRAMLMLNLSANVGLDVMTVGPTDLITMSIKELQDFDAFPLISASYANQKGELLFPPFAVLEKQDFRLGVVGLSTRITDPKYRKEIRYIAPKEALQKTLSLLPSDLDLIIALGSIDDEEAQILVQEETSLAALLTTRGTAYEEPKNNKKNRTLIVETPERGRYIQTLYLHLNTLPQAKLLISSLEQPWRDRIMGQDNPDAQQKIKREGEGRNLVYLELSPLNEAYEPKEKTDTTSILQQFKQEKLVEATQNAEQPITKEEYGYASSGNCATCHSKQFARWVFTGHAKAWESLIRRNSENNPECVQCHSTGFGEVGGLGELTDSNLRRYKSVQCESCHGPLKGHPDSDHVQARPITPKTCLTCHDEANSPNFDFASYLSKASCQMD